MSGRDDNPPANEYGPQWVEVRKPRRLFFGGMLLPLFVMLIFVLGAAATSSHFPASTIAMGILAVSGAILIVAISIGQWVLMFRYIWWRCPRCGHPFFGWWPIRDMHWWRIWSCVHCGLLVDAPNAGSCRDRRIAQ